MLPAGMIPYRWIYAAGSCVQPTSQYAFQIAKAAGAWALLYGLPKAKGFALQLTSYGQILVVP